MNCLNKNFRHLGGGQMNIQDGARCVPKSCITSGMSETSCDHLAAIEWTKMSYLNLSRFEYSEYMRYHVPKCMLSLLGLRQKGHFLLISI